MSTFNNHDDLPLLLTIENLSIFFNISKAMAYKLVKEEGFPLIKIGTRLLIPKEELVKWVEKNTRK